MIKEFEYLILKFCSLLILALLQHSLDIKLNNRLCNSWRKELGYKPLTIKGLF